MEHGQQLPEQDKTILQGGDDSEGFSLMDTEWGRWRRSSPTVSTPPDFGSSSPSSPLSASSSQLVARSVLGRASRL